MLQGISLYLSRMILKGSWDYDLPTEQFKVQWKTTTSKL